MHPQVELLINHFDHQRYELYDNGTPLLPLLLLLLLAIQTRYLYLQPLRSSPSLPDESADNACVRSHCRRPCYDSLQAAPRLQCRARGTWESSIT